MVDVMELRERVSRFQAALDAAPAWVRESLKSGQQFNAYESASNDEDDDQTDWDYLLGIGPITDFRCILDLTGKWRADLLEAALKTAVASLDALDEAARMQERVERLEAALEWYAEQVAGCRKLGCVGDPFRNALDRDGGERARASLSAEMNSEGKG